MERKRFTVRIRRDIGKEVKPGAEQLDGKTFAFRYGWEMDEDDKYPGEIAWIADDTQWPDDAPVWIAGGDLLTPNNHRRVHETY